MATRTVTPLKVTFSDVAGLGIVELAEESWTAKRETAATRRVRRAGELLERPETTITVARKMICALAGLEQPDPLSKMAEFGEKVGAVKART